MASCTRRIIFSTSTAAAAAAAAAATAAVAAATAVAVAAASEECPYLPQHARPTSRRRRTRYQRHVIADTHLHADRLLDRKPIVTTAGRCGSRCRDATRADYMRRSATAVVVVSGLVGGVVEHYVVVVDCRLGSQQHVLCRRLARITDCRL